MRDRAYRRKQEAKHYKRRLKIYLPTDIRINSDGSPFTYKTISELYTKPKLLHTIHSWRELKKIDTDNVKRLRHHYFNDSDKWGKRYGHKVRRRLYKNLDIDTIPQRIHWVKQWETTLHNIMSNSSARDKRKRKLRHRREVLKNIYGQELINEYMQYLKQCKSWGIYTSDYTLEDYLELKEKFDL